ncbi:hypothetical protein CRE_12462 [Caenorhabditis remanei]|uniref:Uncharacterized protein n=1 Tax=Caenorhabditis remanei TaxID=31234 RepID=E3M715_CAERE|nr:hypothetical protein CRE_12462 [Caenorhabditis remanei]
MARFHIGTQRFICAATRPCNHWARLLLIVAFTSPPKVALVQKWKKREGVDSQTSLLPVPLTATWRHPTAGREGKLLTLRKWLPQYPSMLKSIAFCGSSNIAALFENNVKLASTTTGTHFATFEMNQYSTDVHGCDDFLFVANRKQRMGLLDLRTSKMLPVNQINVDQHESMTSSCYNANNDILYASIWNPTTR